MTTTEIANVLAENNLSYKGIRLSTRIAKGCRGMLWKEMTKRKKK